MKDILILLICIIFIQNAQAKSPKSNGYKHLAPVSFANKLSKMEQIYSKTITDPDKDRINRDIGNKPFYEITKLLEKYYYIDSNSLFWILKHASDNAWGHRYKDFPEINFHLNKTDSEFIITINNKFYRHGLPIQIKNKSFDSNSDIFSVPKEYRDLSGGNFGLGVDAIIDGLKKMYLKGVETEKIPSVSWKQIDEKQYANIFFELNIPILQEDEYKNVKLEDSTMQRVEKVFGIRKSA